MTIAITTKHPQYTEFSDDWQRMRDTYRGERIVKERGFEYLPPTPGMIEDGALTSATSLGRTAYDIYRRRARFPDLVREAVEALLGTMHAKPPVINLPTALEPMREKATNRGDSLEVLLRKINEEQLVLGRLGLLGDVFDAGPRAGLPYIAVYKGETIINWDQGARDQVEAQNLNLVVLDESENERKVDFSWEWVRKYRVLSLGDLLKNEPEGEGVYRVAVVREDAKGGFDAAAAESVEPSVRGKTLKKLPFEFINGKDVVPEPEEPPLLGLANQCLTIYRGDADYRQALFMQGQDTLVVIGGDGDETPLRVGAGARIDLPVNGDAKYIGVDSKGLPEMREALQNDRKEAEQKSGRLLDSTSREKEAGSALRVRIAARTATLRQIALSGAFALQSLLRSLAEWVGANPEEVEVVPNLEFDSEKMTGDELGKLMSAKSLGAPLSLESLHTLMATRGLTELDFEDELAQIEEELANVETRPAPMLDPNNLDPNADPNDPNADPDGDPNADPSADPAATKRKPPAAKKRKPPAKA